MAVYDPASTLGASEEIVDVWRRPHAEAFRRVTLYRDHGACRGRPRGHRVGFSTG